MILEEVIKPLDYGVELGHLEKSEFFWTSISHVDFNHDHQKEEGVMPFDRFLSFITISALIVLVQFECASSYTLPDTGQTSCYDDVGNVITCPAPGERFYGQDGNYSGVPQAFRDNGDGTVTDLNTCLVWQQGDSQNVTNYLWQEAVDYCESLDLAGQTDWRLPSQTELRSLVNYSGEILPKTIDVTYFPGCRAARYWSSTEVATYSTAAWSLDFSDNSIDNKYRKDLAYPYFYAPFPTAVRCVRGENLNEGNFVDNSNGTVTDLVTGLMWQQNDDQNDQGGWTWKDSLAYCEGSSLGGWSDWRLPSIRELKTIVDLSRLYPAIDPIFDCDSCDEYATHWSSTSCVVDGQPAGNAYVVNFSEGVSHCYPKYLYPPQYVGYENNVRCVRGGSSSSALTQVITSDLNDDGKAELIGVTTAGQLFYSTDFQNWQWMPGILRQITKGDLNGDGKEDLIGITWTGQIYYTLDHANWQWIPGVLNQISTGDLNGDGRDDVLGLAPDGNAYYTFDLFNWSLMPGAVK